jgi:hypothetical protein
VTSIQGILILGFVIAAVVAGRIFRTKVLYRLIALALFLAAPVLIVFPDFTTVIAHALGVGRGTDLLLYFSLVGGIYVVLLMYLRIRELDQKIAELTRSIALRNARQIAPAMPEKKPEETEAVTRL